RARVRSYQLRAASAPTHSRMEVKTGTPCGGNASNGSRATSAGIQRTMQMSLSVVAAISDTIFGTTVARYTPNGTTTTTTSTLSSSTKACTDLRTISGSLTAAPEKS